MIHAAAWPDAGHGACRLRFSDWLFLASLGIALLIILRDPAEQMSAQTLARHSPLLVALAAAVLAGAGSMLAVRRGQGTRWPLGSVVLPWLLLSAWIVAGGSYARLVDGVRESFLVVGLYMVLVLVAAQVASLSPARERLVQAYLVAASLAGALMVPRMITELSGADRTYHNFEAFVIPLAVYYALRPTRRPVLHAMLAAFFLLSTLAFWKNTAFIVAAITLGYLWLVRGRFAFSGLPPVKQGLAAVSLLLAALMAAAALSLFSRGGDRLPSGNPEYRVRTYEAAFERFRQSPLHGNSFTAPAVEKFTAYRIDVSNGRLPSHSDVLDLVANGGLLALLLWLWAYAGGAFVVWRHALADAPKDDLTAAAHALACMSICSVAVYFFNPLMLQPSSATVLWANAGLLLGIAIHRRQARRKHGRLSRSGAESGGLPIGGANNG